MDHVAGLDDLRPLIFAQNQPMQLWTTDRVEKRLREQFAYAFSARRYPGAPEFELKRIEPGTEFTIGDQVWIPILGQHGTWPVLGYRIGDIVYLTDVSGMHKQEQDKIRGAKVLVVNALRKTPHISHFSLGEAVEFARESEVLNVYFTHISHQMGLHHEVNDELPDGMALAYDGLKLTT
jgi:phosphoribosyl 1,2-cyclic phosphate phosphodiesterase